MKYQALLALVLAMPGMVWTAPLNAIGSVAAREALADFETFAMPVSVVKRATDEDQGSSGGGGFKRATDEDEGSSTGGGFKRATDEDEGSSTGGGFKRATDEDEGSSTGGGFKRDTVIFR